MCVCVTLTHTLLINYLIGWVFFLSVIHRHMYINSMAASPRRPRKNRIQNEPTSSSSSLMTMDLVLVTILCVLVIVIGMAVWAVRRMSRSCGCDGPDHHVTGLPYLRSQRPMQMTTTLQRKGEESRVYAIVGGRPVVLWNRSVPGTCADEIDLTQGALSAPPSATIIPYPGISNDLVPLGHVSLPLTPHIDGNDDV